MAWLRSWRMTTPNVTSAGAMMRNSMAVVNDTVTVTLLILTAAVATVFFIVILPACRAYPWSDEWTYIRPMIAPHGDYTAWLFQQHVDHRIPIQKLLQTALLRVTSFDFRSLIAANMIFAVVVSCVAILSCRLYRGYSSLGDALIPALVMNYGTGYSQWGFEFQFLSTLLFIALFLYFSMLYTLRKQRSYMFGAWCSVAACALTGLNGVIAASAITVLGVQYVLFRSVRERRLPSPRTAIVGAIIALECAALWLSWTPSRVAATHASIGDTIRFAVGMLGSPWLVFGFTHGVVKSVSLFILYAAGFLTAVSSVLARPKEWSSFAVMAVICTGLVLAVSVAYGRGGDGAWQPGLGMHYGTLTIALVIGAWMAVSKARSRAAVELVGLVLLCMGVGTFWANWSWRAGLVQQTYEVNRAAELALCSHRDIGSVVQEYIGDYYFVNTKQTNAQVSSGIRMLRSGACSERARDNLGGAALP